MENTRCQPGTRTQRLGPATPRFIVVASTENGGDLGKLDDVFKGYPFSGVVLEGKGKAPILVGPSFGEPTYKTLLPVAEPSVKVSGGSNRTNW